MSEEQNWFWKIIDGTIPPNEHYTKEEHVRLLNQELSKLADDDLLKFHDIFEQMMVKAYLPSLWNAGYIMANGMGDDDFSNFRSALIAHGNRVFKSTIAEPEFLATYPLAETLIDNESFFNPTYSTAVERHNEEYALRNIRFLRLPELSEQLLLEEPDLLCKVYPKLFTRFWKRN